MPVVYSGLSFCYGYFSIQILQFKNMPPFEYLVTGWENDSALLFYFILFFLVAPNVLGSHIFPQALLPFAMCSLISLIPFLLQLRAIFIR